MLPDEVIPANVKLAATIRFMYNKVFYTDSQYAICLHQSTFSKFILAFCIHQSTFSKFIREVSEAL